MNTSAVIVLGLAVVAGVGGCASAKKEAAAPVEKSWVADPSAPLPEGFPPPGQVGRVVVKEYPAYRMAVAYAPKAEEAAKGESADALFWPLYRHIDKHNIPMSSPVEMTYEVTPGGTPEMAAMGFVYTQAKVGKVGRDMDVQVMDVPAMQVVSVGVSGAYTAERFAKGYRLLEGWLGEHPEWVVQGKPRFLAYNSPFVLSLWKSGEVQVPVRRR